MFCKKCGSNINDKAKFCPKCGTTTPVNVNNTFTSPVKSETTAHYNNRFSHSTVAVKKKSSGAKKIVITATAIAAVAAIAITGVFGCIKSKPVPALALGLQNLSEDIKNMESCTLHLIFDEDGENIVADCDIQMDIEERIFYLNGSINEDGQNGEFAVAIEGNAGAYGLIYNGDTDVEEMDSSVIKDMWESLELETDSDIEQIIKDSGLESELNDYIDIDNVNEACENLTDRLTKLETVNDLEEILEIEKEGLIGEKTYRASLDFSKVMDAVEYLLDIIDEEAGDAIVGNWFNELCHELDYYKTEENIDLGNAEWIIKNRRIRQLSYDINVNDSGYYFGMDLSVDADYSLFNSLKSFACDMTIYDEGYYGSDSVSMELYISNINKIKDVKESIDPDLLEDMGMD